MTSKSVFAGFGGQGVLLMGYMLALTAMRAGKEVTYLPSYGAEVRGGTANCTVVVSEDPIASPVASNPDHAVVMNNPSLVRFANVVTTGGLVLVNQSLVQAQINRDDLNLVRIPANELANELGESRSANVVMMGAFSQITGVISPDELKVALAETGLGKKEKVLEINRRAVDVGAKAARQALGKE